ncbi:MAG: c-type cytochrome [Betaproteobacteria bacterium]|nr:c-type cytochrome [Betaproteobacteria bacterium]MDE2310775.1 c-type cytochrome [Betaproteobacteria bacterium]
MNIFLKVAAFSLVMVAGFWGFASFGIPQIKPAPPPVEEKVDLGAMTMDQFIALGGKIFNGKGTCTLCHNKMGRAPMLSDIGKNAPLRLKDPRYKGTAKTIEEYIFESMTKPSMYVVAGFGKSGTNDTESPMPDVTGGGIGLNPVEVKAVIAYLQDAGGAEVTVEIPAMPKAGAEAPKAEEAAPLKTAQEVIAKFGCGACHKVAGQTGEIGPNLTKIGATKNKDYIRQSILDPDAVIAKGYPAGMMPKTFGEQMKAKELEMLVDYLAGSK